MKGPVDAREKEFHHYSCVNIVNLDSPQQSGTLNFIFCYLECWRQLNERPLFLHPAFLCSSIGRCTLVSILLRRVSRIYHNSWLTYICVKSWKNKLFLGWSIHPPSPLILSGGADTDPKVRRIPRWLVFSSEQIRHRVWRKSPIVRGHFSRNLETRKTHTQAHVFSRFMTV